MPQVDAFESVLAAWKAGEPGATVASARQYLEREPEHYVILKILGEALTELRHYADAESAYDRALAMAPGEVAYRIHRAKGLMYEAQGRLDEAVTSFVRATNEAPDDASAYIYMGAMLARLGRLAEAEDWQRRATACTHGAIEEAWFNLGLVLRDQERLREACACLEKALAIDPGYEGASAVLEEVRAVLDAQAEA
jgi:tetratricopeptide (TPR) repeat protein